MRSIISKALIVVLLSASIASADTARFKIYDPVEGDRTATNSLLAQMDTIYCRDENGIGPDGYGFTWEKRLSETHSQIWLRTSPEVMSEIKALFMSPDYIALGFEHLEDIPEQEGGE